jgi:hypothetical protein
MRLQGSASWACLNEDCKLSVASGHQESKAIRHLFQRKTRYCLSERECATEAGDAYPREMSLHRAHRQPTH